MSSLTIKSLVKEDMNNNNCKSNDLNSTDCFCCLSNICFNYDKRDNCGTDNVAHPISCRSHCEDAGSNNNNFLNQHVKYQYIYKILFLNNFSLTKENTNFLITAQKIITKSTPTYISIQSILI